MFDFIYNMIKLIVYSTGVISGSGLLYLYWTQPDDKTFEPYLTSYIKQINQPPPQTGIVGKLMTSAAATALPTFSNIIIKDYKFIKVASVTILDQTVYFVGIVQNWFPAETFIKSIKGISTTISTQQQYQQPQSIIADADSFMNRLSKRSGWQ